MSNPYRGVTTIGEFTKAFRAKHGLSQLTLAQELKPPKTAPYIGKIEADGFKLPFEFLRTLMPLLDSTEKQILKALVAEIATKELE